MRMTQAHLSEASGVSVRTIRRAERGAPLSDEVARSLCAVLGVDVSELGAEVRRKHPGEPASRRYMRPGEVGTRLFVRSLFRWIGGLHPFIGLQVAFMPVWSNGNAYTKALLPLMSAGSILLFYHSARRSGCSPREALEALQGKRFLDGIPVELDERAEELRIAATQGT